MEFYEEFLLIGFVSLLLAFLIGKAAAACAADAAARQASQPATVPLVADFVLDRGVGLEPIEEEEEEPEKSEGTSSADACEGAAVPAELDPAQAGVVEVGERRLDDEVGGVELGKEHTEERPTTEAEIDVPRAEESSAKKEDNEVEIRGIADDLVKQEEAGVAKDVAGAGEIVAKVVGSSAKKEDMEVETGRRIAYYLVKQEGTFVKDEADVAEAVEKVVELRMEETVENEDARPANEEKEETSLQGEDDWEGIERSELEKLFGVAAEFVGSEKGGDAVSKLSNEVQMQLYGLHRVATEGPCYEPQPMALKVSARAKWNAWQRLGTMNPESAMEQYIDLLNESTPGWMEEKPGDEAKGHNGNDPLAAEVSPIAQHEPKSSSQDKSESERLVRDSYSIEGATDMVQTGSKIFKEGLTKLFFFNMHSPTRVSS